MHRLLGAILGLLMLSASANAGFIDAFVRTEWHFDDLGEVIATEDALVGPGIEFTERFGGPNIDIDDATIGFSGANAGAFSAAAFNGFVFTDIFGAIPPITGVTIIGQAGYVGFDASRIWYTDDVIFANFQAIERIGASSFVTLAVDYVPEPGTLILLGAGLLGLAGASRRRS